MGKGKDEVVHGARLEEEMADRFSDAILTGLTSDDTRFEEMVEAAVRDADASLTPVDVVDVEDEVDDDKLEIEIDIDDPDDLDVTEHDD